MKRKEIYKGSDQSELRKFLVDIDNQTFDISYSSLVLIQKDEIPADNLLSLFVNNEITMNPIAGFNSKEGTSLYLFQQENINVILSLGEVNRGLYSIVLEDYFALTKDSKSKITLSVYKKISYSHDPQIMGIPFPQIAKIQNASGDTISKFQRARDINEIDFDEVTFAAKLGAKDTDFKSSAFLAYSGFFISKKLEKIFKEFSEIENLDFRDINIQYTNEVKEETFLAVTQPKIDFKLSGFSLLKNGALIKKYSNDEISDLYSLKKKAANAVLDDLSAKVTPRFVSLKDNSILFSMPGAHAFLLKNDFHEKLINLNITGLDAEKYNVPFFNLI